MKRTKRSTEEYIRAIVDHGSISVAAEKLGISQPALSLYLKKLESELGSRIFDRLSQPLELTDAGKVYLEYLNELDKLKSDYEKRITDVDALKTGHLTIGGAVFFNVAYMPKAINAFIDKFPNVDIELVEDMVPNLADDAYNGKLDIFLTPVPDKDDRFTYEEFLDEKVFIAVPRSWQINSQLKDKEVTLDQLEQDKLPVLTKAEFEAICQRPFVRLKRGQDLYKKSEALFEKFDCRPDKVILAEQTITSLYLTNSGAGSSLITDSSLKNCNLKENPALYYADDKICRRKMYIAYPKNKYLSRAAEEFIKVIKDINR